MKIRIIIMATAAPAVLLLSGCETNPPCEQLPAPSQVEVQAAREGAEVEREVAGSTGDAECVVVGDRWVDQTDDE